MLEMVSPSHGKKLTVGVCSPFPLFFSIPHLRILNPLKALARHVRFRLIPTPAHFDSECDLYLIQRDFVTIHHYAFVTEKLVPNHPCLFEIDDNLSALPPNHPDFNYYASVVVGAIEKFLKNFPELPVITTNQTLAEALGAPHRPCHLFANHLPAQLIAEVRRARPAKESDAPIRIGFAGTTSHIPDLKKIESALLRIASLYRERVEIVLMGAWTQDLEACEHVRLIKTPVDYWNYLPTLAKFDLDIALAPLDDTPFNRCKSDLKWVEYSALGVPTVCSDVAPFSEAKALGLAKVLPNDPEAWFATLIDLIENPATRKELGEAAYAYVRDHRTLESHAAEYAAILNTVLPPEKELPPPHELTISPVTIPTPEAIYNPEDRFEAWRKRRSLQEADAEVFAERMMSWAHRPVVTLITFARQSDLPLLAQTTDSLQTQLYPHWRWIVVSDQPVPDPIFQEADFLGWLQLDTLDAPEIVAQAVNALLPEYGGDAVAVLPAGFQLAPEALLLIAEAFVEHPQVGAVYSDHDHLQGETRHSPWFKPDFDRVLLYGFDYIGPAVWFRTETLIALGGFQPYPHAERYDALLRVSEIPEARIHHVTEPLVSIPEPTDSLHESHDSEIGEASQEALARRLALEDHFARTQQNVAILPGLLPGTWRIEREMATWPKVSVIMPVADVYHLVAPAVTSLLEHTQYPDWELILVDHATTDPDIAALFAEIRAQHPYVSIVRDQGPYALARLYNVGAAAANGEILVFLHCDIEAREPHWLERLVREAADPTVGAVGPLLVQPEFSLIESAGLWLGGSDLWAPARPAYREAKLNDVGALKQLALPHRVSALSSVGFTTRRALFAQLGGFDEETFAQFDFEIDYCLKAEAAGFEIRVQPLSRLIHHGSAVVGRMLRKPLALLQHQEARTQTHRALFARWGERLVVDPFASPHFDYAATTPTLDLNFPLSWQRHHNNRIKVLGFPVKGGSGQYRVRMPLQALVRAGWVQAESVPEDAPRMPSVSEIGKLKPDVILLHQRLGPAVEETVEAWKSLYPNLRLIFGMDDRLDAVPRKSSMYHLARRTTPDARARLRKMFALADAVVVSTDPLAELVTDIAPGTEVHVIPNAIEWETWEPLYQELEQKRRHPLRPYRKPRVGWVGAMQHRGDLELLIPVIEATKDEVHWVFMGMWLPEFEHLVAEKHGWVDFHDYPKKMAELDLDLALAPLEYNEFNEAKSNLRIIEYGALGYPVIASDITPYRTNNPPIILVPNESEKWKEVIIFQLKNKDININGKNLHKWTISNYIMEKTVKKWNDLFLRNTQQL
ncbi:MAG: glycosyltransferase [Hydrogenophilus sp.]